MHQNNCKCGHHKFGKLVGILACLSAIGFWVSTWKGGSLFGISEIHYFKEVVVFGLIHLIMQKGCSCCCGGCGTCSVEGMSGGVCKHAMGCTCGDCGRCKQ